MYSIPWIMDNNYIIPVDELLSWYLLIIFNHSIYYLILNYRIGFIMIVLII